MDIFCFGDSVIIFLSFLCSSSFNTEQYRREQCSSGKCDYGFWNLRQIPNFEAEKDLYATLRPKFLDQKMIKIFEVLCSNSSFWQNICHLDLTKLPKFWLLFARSQVADLTTFKILAATQLGINYLS